MALLCFSHLRWDFVYQRPQHLLVRFANTQPVYYIEEPIFYAAEDRCKVQQKKTNLYIVRFYLAGHEAATDVYTKQRQMLDALISEYRIKQIVSWYYTPLALLFASHVDAELVVYDCMDELSAFKFAPPILKEMEQQLLQKADVVFTGGYSLFEAKKDRHSNIHAFPSSIDKEHFITARQSQNAPLDQAGIPHPRIGFYGVLDERLDLNLIETIALSKPDWQIVLIGPVVKIDKGTLPRHANIHYLGGKTYDQLPQYLAGWDVAMICFAINESTSFISPTKTPEYLSAGKPVVSSAIKDVINPYGEKGLVSIAHSNTEFIDLVEAELSGNVNEERQVRIDAFLADVSWDKTWRQMVDIINDAVKKKRARTKTVHLVAKVKRKNIPHEKDVAYPKTPVVMLDDSKHVKGNSYGLV